MEQVVCLSHPSTSPASQTRLRRTHGQTFLHTSVQAVPFSLFPGLLIPPQKPSEMAPSITCGPGSWKLGSGPHHLTLPCPYRHHLVLRS